MVKTTTDQYKHNTYKTCHTFRFTTLNKARLPTSSLNWLSLLQNSNHWADLRDAIDAGVITPKIFKPKDLEKHGYIIMLVGHNDEDLVEWGEKIGL